jgi:IS605 OrfB family transposase
MTHYRLSIEYTVGKMIRTVSLLLPDLPEDRFLPMMETCADIFNTHTAWASENRTWSKKKAHEALYHNIREARPEVNSCLLQATRDCALEAVKRCNKGRRDEWKTPMKRTLSIRYDLRTLSLRGNLLTLSCIGRRFRVVLDHVPDHFRDIVENWRCKGATLKYVRGMFRLNLVYEADAPPKIAGRAMGIDTGSRNFAVTSDGDRHPKRNPSALRAAKRRYDHNRRELQAKGTPSAKRRLRATAGREERFSRDLCHAVSKAIAATSGVGVFVLEDLGGIRDGRKGRRRSRRLNREVHNLPFSRLRFDLTYKAKAEGKTVVTVDPAYTSQRCHRCGHTEPGNRRKSRFRCRACGFCCHADNNASRNILFVYESGAVLCMSPRISSSRRKAPGGQAAVNQPTMCPCGRKPLA